MTIIDAGLILGFLTAAVVLFTVVMAARAHDREMKLRREMFDYERSQRLLARKHFMKHSAEQAAAAASAGLGRRLGN